MTTLRCDDNPIYSGQPRIFQPLGLGLGIDITWGKNGGFVGRAGEGRWLSPRLVRFLEGYRSTFNYFFLAFQPMNRNLLTASDYYPAYDALFEVVGPLKARAFHHTLLNMGAMECYDRQTIYEFTNELIDRYGFSWIVEDLGIWSIRGKSVPFPLPPLLTPSGLRACITNISEIREAINAPLCVEFPGFSEGTNFHIGAYDAFDYLRIIAEDTGVAVTLDIGHILSYQWLRGRRNSSMLDGLELLPLDQCFEFHLSGCHITAGKFRDLHHGILLDEQITLLKYLAPLCPNLRAITYEDPRFGRSGELIEKALPNFGRLVAFAAEWSLQRE